ALTGIKPDRSPAAIARRKGTAGAVRALIPERKVYHGRFPRFSQLYLIGAAGLAAMLLLPGDEARRPAAGLSVAGDAADPDVVVPLPGAGVAAVPQPPPPRDTAMPAAAGPPEVVDAVPVAAIAPSQPPPPTAAAEEAVDEPVPQRTLWVG